MDRTAGHGSVDMVCECMIWRVLFLFLNIFLGPLVYLDVYLPLNIEKWSLFFTLLSLSSLKWENTLFVVVVQHLKKIRTFISCPIDETSLKDATTSCGSFLQFKVYCQTLRSSLSDLIREREWKLGLCRSERKESFRCESSDWTNFFFWGVLLELKSSLSLKKKKLPTASFYFFVFKRRHFMFFLSIVF